MCIKWRAVYTLFLHYFSTFSPDEINVELCVLCRYHYFIKIHVDNPDSLCLFLDYFLIFNKYKSYIRNDKYLAKSICLRKKSVHSTELNSSYQLAHSCKLKNSPASQGHLL